MSPVFLSVDDVLLLHADQVEEFGGSAGVKERALLESAVGQATFDGVYLHDDLFAMAAAYLFHLVKNHPFVDGNKRAGLAAALVFLEINGVVLDESSTDRLYEVTLAVAAGRMDKPTLTRSLRDLFRSPQVEGESRSTLVP